MTDALPEHEPSTDPIDSVEPAPSRGLDVLSVVSIVVIVASLALLAGWWFGHPRPPDTDSVDVGFLRDMIDHHDQANQMATLMATKDVAPEVAVVANEVLQSQRYEVGVMSTWLDDWGLARGDLDRKAMAWMQGMSPTSVSNMPGMQTADAMQALRDADGAEAEQQFISMMIDHHRGGIHMAEDAARRAEDPKLRDLAGRIAKVQASEIAELQRLEEQLGLQVTK